ncbi:pilus assembly protein PilM [Bacillus sp. FJAT-49732]|uniref:Pilus assembly protein PilM n=1 Tax=Lederbergia citrisecunda TaxID=2833583 RepID=A0A942YJX9_9BACI|nr:pilus assembly protein PilM [Lederbergia citrisecunda]MBS4199818.1 pilus assembly protein PilM [Lederbergia citrisecunda]
MAFKLFKRSLKTANLVFTDQVIRFMETNHGGKRVILQVKEHPLHPGTIKEGKIMNPKLLHSALEKCINKWKIKRRDIRFLIPDPFIIVRQVKVPLDIQKDEINGYLFMETGTSIHLPFEDPVIDSVILDLEEDHYNILLVAAPREIVHSYINILDQVKLRPIVADIAPLSLYRLYHAYDMTNPEDHLLLLNFDNSLLTIAIFHQHVPIFVRPITSDILLESSLSIVDNANSSAYLEEAISEIVKVMDFYQYSLNHGEVQINRVILSGDHGELSKFEEMLRTGLEMEIEHLTVNNDGKMVPTAHLPALGLSLKEVSSL